MLWRNHSIRNIYVYMNIYIYIYVYIYIYTHIYIWNWNGMDLYICIWIYMFALHLCHYHCFAKLLAGATASSPFCDTGMERDPGQASFPATLESRFAGKTWLGVSLSCKALVGGAGWPVGSVAAEGKGSGFPPTVGSEGLETATSWALVLVSVVSATWEVVISTSLDLSWVGITFFTSGTSSRHSSSSASSSSPCSPSSYPSPATDCSSPAGASSPLSPSWASGSSLGRGGDGSHGVYYTILYYIYINIIIYIYKHVYIYIH